MAARWVRVTGDHRGCLFHHTSPSGRGRGDCCLGPKLAFSVSKSKEQLLSSLVCSGMLAAAEEQLPQQLVKLDPLFEAEFAVMATHSGEIIWQQILSRRNASAKLSCILGRPLDSANPLLWTILCGDHFMWFYEDIGQIIEIFCYTFCLFDRLTAKETKILLLQGPPEFIEYRVGKQTALE